MSVLIKGMKIPTRCGRCDMCIPAFDDGMFDHYECCITAAIIDNIGEKMEDCPLVHVPPHGRLVDADALEYHADNVRDPMGRTEKTVMWKKIEDAPTIIQAEECEA